MSAAPPISVAPIFGIVMGLGAAQRQCSTWPSAKERLHPWLCRSAGTLHQAVAKNLIIGREVIGSVQRIEMATDLELFEIVQTGDTARLRFGPAQPWQQQRGEDRDDCNHH